ncbi:MAG TPA: TIGR01841 family phasin [Rhizomicrobium sp.]|jgi:phasin family protein
MTKAKTAAESEFATAEINFNAGADAIKAGFDKAIAGYDTAVGYSKDTAEALIKSATIAGKGAEVLHNEFYAYTKQSMENSIAAGKAILGAKSVHEAIEAQTDYAKSAFENYVAELSRFNQLFTAAAKDSFAPLQDRAQAWVEAVQTSTAA